MKLNMFSEEQKKALEDGKILRCEAHKVEVCITEHPVRAYWYKFDSQNWTSVLNSLDRAIFFEAGTFKVVDPVVAEVSVAVAECRIDGCDEPGHAKTGVCAEHLREMGD